MENDDHDICSTATREVATAESMRENILSKAYTRDEAVEIKSEYFFDERGIGMFQ
jgi:hypothetical protein